jgi:hypothetical protein
MSCAFSCLFECDKAAWINADYIATFNKFCSSKEANNFYSSVYKLQQQAILDWNATADSVTMSFKMGFVGICEDSAAGAGSVVLNMLLKFGLLKYNENELWELEENANKRQLYSFGDRKSNKNCTAFLSTFSHRPLTFEELSMQAEIFLETFHNIMFLPGDWHTRMNMLQTIYKEFWVDILNPMKTFLGWKCVSRDVCG